MKYSAEQITKWPDIGQTENEEWGVNSIHAKQLKSGWVYACLYWRYGKPDVEWILENGKLIQDD